MRRNTQNQAMLENHNRQNKLDSYFTLHRQKISSIAILLINM